MPRRFTCLMLFGLMLGTTAHGDDQAGEFAETAITIDTSKVGPLPPDWNLTPDDLMDELRSGERSSFTQEELTWATQYERGQLPEGTRFPRADEVYVVTVAHETDFVIKLSDLAYQGGYTMLLEPGDRFRISLVGAVDPPVWVHLVPVEGDRLKKRLPAQTRDAMQAGSDLSFTVDTVDLLQFFALASGE